MRNIVDMTQATLNKKIQDRTLTLKDLFNEFITKNNIKATISISLLRKSMNCYFNDTEIIRNNHRAVERTNDSKKFSFMVKAINATKPIRFNGDATSFEELYINEIFSLYCGINHIYEQNIKDIVLDNMENFVYLIFHQEINYLQLALTMDLVFKKEISTTGKGK